jgi:hypothetical protein
MASFFIGGTMNYAMVLIASLIIMISGWFQESSVFDNYTPNATSIASTPFEEALSNHTLGYSSVRFVTPESASETLRILDWDSVTNTTQNNITTLKKALAAHNYKGLETIPASNGRQSVCLIQYDENFAISDSDKVIKLGTINEASPSLVRASSFHEIEHCMMPQWMLRGAVDKLIARYGDPGASNSEQFRDDYMRTLAEIFADSFAMTFMPDADGASGDILKYRIQESNAGKQHGVYRFNARVLLSLNENIPRLKDKEITNTETNRRLLFNYMVDNSPLPTPKEIKVEFKL